MVGRHGVFPAVSHDEAERFNVLAQMNRHLATNVMPGVAEAYEARVPKGHNDRRALLRDLAEDRYFQGWSALRRNTMEMRQQAGRWVTLRQKDDLAAKARAGEPLLELDPDLAVPRYVSAVDHHCMPGSYHTSYGEGDVTNGANYDVGLFATTGGMLGRYNDGGGLAAVKWVGKNLSGFAPRRILDLGCTVAHNAVPIAQSYPQAEVICVDVGEPVLRYAAARAASMGVENVRFVQADATDLSRFEDGSFDWIQSTMFIHETSLKAMRAIFAETRRLLAPGGVVLHVEQPQYTDDMPLFEQAMRDWDSLYNNEPFWSQLHGIDLEAELVRAGFARDELIHSSATAVVDKDVFPDAADEEGEDYGRKAAWEVIGARRGA
jgi:SAM-dependent methyltransferase